MRLVSDKQLRELFDAAFRNRDYIGKLRGRLRAANRKVRELRKILREGGK